MKALDKKGQLEGVYGLILGVVGAAVTLVVAFTVMSELRDSVAVCPTDYPTYNETNNLCTNSTGGTIDFANSGGTGAANDLITKVGLVPNFIGIIIVVALASIVLGFFFLRGREQ